MTEAPSFTHPNAEQAKGWWVCDTDEGPQLQTVNEEGRFSTDNQAWLHVWKEATQGTPIALAALNFLEKHNPREYENIVAYCKQ